MPADAGLGLAERESCRFQTLLVLRLNGYVYAASRTARTRLKAGRARGDHHEVGVKSYALDATGAIRDKRG